MTKTDLDRLARLPVANVGDAGDRLGLLDAGIGPVWPGARLAGRAFTVWTRAGDNRAIHEALAAAAEGDVIVVNGAGALDRALIGELIGIRARARGIAGFVVDGAVRDADGLRELDMPVFARGTTPAGPYKDGPGRLQVPIAVGGVAVLPGDVVLGDADGVAIVPSADAGAIAAAAEAVRDREDARMVGYREELAAWQSRTAR